MMVSNSEPLPEGTVIMAENQYAGRGQVNSRWEAEPGKNLTFSILLRPSFLSITSQFSLNMAVSLGIHKALKNLTGEGLSIKWPNDIYFKDRKTGGILIENIISAGHIKACIVGIGINVNQEVFDPALEGRAGSLYQILQNNVNLISLLTQICSQIEAEYLKLKGGKHFNLRQDYINALYRYKQKASYRQNGEIFEGSIVDVSETGFLILETEAGLTSYNFKEIEFVRP